MALRSLIHGQERAVQRGTDLAQFTSVQCVAQPRSANVAGDELVLPREDARWTVPSERTAATPRLHLPHSPDSTRISAIAEAARPTRRLEPAAMQSGATPAARRKASAA